MPDLPSPVLNAHAPSRHIHLGFHNHGAVKDVGAQFDPEEFALTLKRAHVDSVTCFARCYHGWMYYNSNLFPERVHPNLVHRNLLELQIEACHQYGLSVPVFTSIRWDNVAAREHPEWCVVGADVKVVEPSSQHGGVREAPLCVNTEYRTFLKAHVGELIESLPLDGIVFDSGSVIRCACSRCRAGMEAEGLDPTDADVQLAYAQVLRREFMAEMVDFIRGERPEIGVTFDSSEAGPPLHENFVNLSHIEFDVQSSGHLDGDMKVPLLARRHRGFGPSSVGRTSRFHREWDGFQTYKGRPALEYDCFGLLSQGCQVMIVDQLSPSGQLDDEAYELIGAVYADAALKERWFRDAVPVTEIAVLDPELFGGTLTTIQGCIRMLEEGAHQFDIIDATADFEKYAVVILPDSITVDDALSTKCDAYLSQGGRLLASFESGMNKEKTAFNLKSMGVESLGLGPIASDGLPARGRRFGHCDYVDYLVPKGPIGSRLPETAHLMYTRAVEVASLPEADILADVLLPVSDCTFRNFGLRNQSLPSDRVGGPAVVSSGNVIYFAHKIFDMYAHYAPPWVKQLFLNALNELLSEPLLRHDGPGTLRASITKQEAHKRWVVHLLHYIPNAGATGLKTVEEIIPLYEVKVSLRVPKEVCQVAIRPQHYDQLEFWEADGYLEFVVPRVEGHTMIAVEFA